jgi:hypothetical protein
MRAIVVHHQMNFKATGKVRIDVVEKSQELLLPVPPVALTDRHSAGHIHCCKQ